MSGGSPGPEFARDLVALLPRLRRYARVLTRDQASADDLVQDTVERALARRAQWRPGSDLRAWLFTIMHNRRVDVARSERFLDDAGPEVDREAAQLRPDARIDPLDMQRAFDRLAEEHRQVLLLVAVEDLSYEAAARSLGVPVGTVMSRLSRARRRLREALEDGPRVHAPRITRIK